MFVGQAGYPFFDNPLLEFISFLYAASELPQLCFELIDLLAPVLLLQFKYYRQFFGQVLAVIFSLSLANRAFRASFLAAFSISRSVPSLRNPRRRCTSV